jgi:hypothetical protein
MNIMSNNCVYNKQHIREHQRANAKGQMVVSLLLVENSQGV